MVLTGFMYTVELIEEGKVKHKDFIQAPLSPRIPKYLNPTMNRLLHQGPGIPVATKH